MRTRIDIVDTCLLRLGAEPLQSEAAPGAEALLRIYETTVAHLLSVNPWSFNTVTRKLPRLSAPPPRYYLYQFEIPPDMIGAPRAVFDRADCARPYTEWEITDGTLHANAAELWLRHDRQAAPARWPGYFAALAEVAIMAEMALTVREDAVLRDRLLGQAYGTPAEGGTGGMLGTAMALDSHGKPAPRIETGNNPFVSARWER